MAWPRILRLPLWVAALAKVSGVALLVLAEEKGLEAYWRATGNRADNCKLEAEKFGCF